MDAATAAGMSDPELNPNFRRRWQEPPCQAPSTPITTTEPPSPAANDRLQRLARLLHAEWRRARMLANGGVR